MIVFWVVSPLYVVVLWVATNLFVTNSLGGSFHDFSWLSLSSFVLTHTALLHYITDRDNVEWTWTLALFVIPVLARCRTITLRIGWSFYLLLKRDVIFARSMSPNTNVLIGPQMVLCPLSQESILPSYRVERCDYILYGNHFKSKPLLLRLRAKQNVPLRVFQQSKYYCYRVFL